MKLKRLNYLIMILTTIFLISCSANKNSYEESLEQFRYYLNGKDYDFAYDVYIKNKENEEFDKEVKDILENNISVLMNSVNKDNIDYAKNIVSLTEKISGENSILAISDKINNIEEEIKVENIIVEEPKDKPQENESYNEEIIYNKYGNARYGYKIDYPTFLTDKFESDNGDGIVLKDKDSTVELRVYGSNNIFNKGAKDELEDFKKSIEGISYESLSGNSFVLSWELDSHIYYRCTVIGEGSSNSFIIQYPKDKQSVFDSVVTRLYESFEVGDLKVSH